MESVLERERFFLEFVFKVVLGVFATAKQAIRYNLPKKNREDFHCYPSRGFKLSERKLLSVAAYNL